MGFLPLSRSALAFQARQWPVLDALFAQRLNVRLQPDAVPVVTIGLDRPAEVPTELHVFTFQCLD